MCVRLVIYKDRSSIITWSRSDLQLRVFCQTFVHIFFFPTWASYLNQLILQVSVTLRCGNNRSTIYESYRYADQAFLCSLHRNTFILKHVQNSDLLAHIGTWISHAYRRTSQILAFLRFCKPVCVCAFFCIYFYGNVWYNILRGQCRLLEWLVTGTKLCALLICSVFRYRIELITSSQHGST